VITPVYLTETAEIGLTLGLNLGPLPESVLFLGEHPLCLDFLAINGGYGAGVSVGLKRASEDNNLRLGVGAWGDGEFAVYVRTATASVTW
jgi:hypothetical protein